MEFQMENRLFNVQAMNYFQTYDSSRTDRNFVHEWIESRWAIAQSDREDEAWEHFAKYLQQGDGSQGQQDMEDYGQAIVSTVPHDQAEFKSCFAFAIATMIRACEKHIYGRVSKEHYALVKSIVESYGANMGKTVEILMELCEPLRLLVKREDVDEEEVQKVVNVDHRCVLVRYRMTKNQFKNF